MNMIELYFYSRPDETIQSPRYGDITYRRWLEHEKALIESAPGRVAEIVRNDIDGTVALFVNDVGEHYEDVSKVGARSLGLASL